MSEHTSSPPPADLRLAPSFLVSVGVVGVLLLLWIFHLWPQWSTDPELSHGLLTPFFFGALLFEARTRGTARFLSPTPRLRLARGAVLLCAVLGLGIAGLYAAALDWSHALVNAVLAVALTARPCIFPTIGKELVQEKGVFPIELVEAVVVPSRRRPSP